MRSFSEHSRALALLLSAFTLGIAVTAIPSRASAEIVDRIAAQVNKNIITVYDISQAAPAYLLNHQQSPKQLEIPGFLASIEKPVLEDMVNRRLYTDDAQKLKVSISEDELNQYLARMREAQGFATEDQQAQALAEYGVTLQQFKDFARSELLRMRLMQVKIGHQINVSDDEVNEKMKEISGSNNGLKPYIDVSHINLIPKDSTPEAKEEAYKRAQEALEKIKQGEKFEDVAKEMSDDTATANDGGHIGKVNKDNILPEFAKVAFSLPVGQVSPIVETPAGYHIILVLDKGEEEDPHADQMKQMVRAHLMQQKEEDIYRDYIDKLKQRSFVDIKLK